MWSEANLYFNEAVERLSLIRRLNFESFQSEMSQRDESMIESNRRVKSLKFKSSGSPSKDRVFPEMEKIHEWQLGCVVDQPVFLGFYLFPLGFRASRCALPAVAQTLRA